MSINKMSLITSLKNNSKTTKRWLRINRKYLNLKFFVHNGIRYVNVDIKNNMLQHKLGEFAYSRKKPLFKNIKKRRN